MDNPGVLIVAAWITFFALFWAAIIAVIGTRSRSRAPLIATTTLAALLVLELWAINQADFAPDIAEPGRSPAASASN